MTDAVDRADKCGLNDDRLANAAWWRLLCMEYLALSKLRTGQTAKPSPDTNDDGNDKKDDKNDKDNKENDDRKDENNGKKTSKIG